MPSNNAQTWYPNYFEINFRRNLNASSMGSQFSFRDRLSVGTGNVSEFRISGINNNNSVWVIMMYRFQPDRKTF